MKRKPTPTQSEVSPEVLAATLAAIDAKYAKERAEWEAQQAKEKAELAYQRAHWNEI